VTRRTGCRARDAASQLRGSPRRARPFVVERDEILRFSDDFDLSTFEQRSGLEALSARGAAARARYAHGAGAAHPCCARWIARSIVRAA
jgi:hypothetical protein